jgi:Ca-activated chloride channel family protein
MRAFIGTVLLIGSSVCLAQKPAQEPLRVDVNLVNVAFSARDANGGLVDNLTQSDVELFEDGAPQKIAFFARSLDLPLTLGLIVDASGSQEHSAKKHKNDLEVFLKEVLGPKDRAFLVCFGNHLRLVSDFTPNGMAIIVGMELYDKASRKFPELGPPEKRELGTAIYDSIFYPVTEKLAQQNGRRALLLFSDGEDNSSSHDMMTAIEAAQREDVLVFAIRYTEKDHGKLTARNQYGIRVMERIARETGGEHIDAAVTDPHTYFKQIGEELRTSYELAYYPTNKVKDDSFRKILIKPRRDGITVRAKTGYFPR